VDALSSYALRKLFHEIAYSLSSTSHPTAVPATLKPILNKVVDEFDGKIHFVEIDIEQDRDIAEMLV